MKADRLNHLSRAWLLAAEQIDEIELRRQIVAHATFLATLADCLDSLNLVEHKVGTFPQPGMRDGADELNIVPSSFPRSGWE